MRVIDIIFAREGLLHYFCYAHLHTLMIIYYTRTHLLDPHHDER